MTQVWLTCEVASATCPTPIGPECILKDVWLDTSARTERELQNAIFSDIQKAFEPDAESLLENQLPTQSVSFITLTFQYHERGVLAQPMAYHDNAITPTTYVRFHHESFR